MMGGGGGVHAMLQQILSGVGRGGSDGHGHINIVGNMPPGMLQHINAQTLGPGLMMGPGPGAQRAATDAESKVNNLIAELLNRTLDCDDVPAIDLTADSDDEEAKKDDDKDESSCMVCLDGWNAGEEVSMQPCFHQFHKKCVQSWWVRKAKDAAMSSGHVNDRAGRAVCPMCRSDVANDLAKSREAFKDTQVDKNSKSNKNKRKRQRSVTSNTGRPRAQVRAVAPASSNAATAARPVRVVMPRVPHDYFGDDYDEGMDSDYLGGEDDDDEDPEDLAIALDIASRYRRQARRGRRAAVSERGGVSSAAASGSAPVRTHLRPSSVRALVRIHHRPSSSVRAPVRTAAARASNALVIVIDSSDDDTPVQPSRNTRQRRQSRTGGGGGASASSLPSTPQSPQSVDLLEM
jgi:hypothetical protein